MAPSTVISSTSQRGHSSASGKTLADVAASNTLNPLGASFGGPVVTASHEDTSVGPLLLDPTGSSATTDVPASATQTFSLLPLISSTPSSKATPSSSLSPNDRREPSISQATLIGVTVAISVIAFIALCLLYYLWWRKRHPTKPGESGATHRVLHILRLHHIDRTARSEGEGTASWWVTCSSTSSCGLALTVNPQ
ncbi:hypothetical protein L226DRAFT_359084 [Lentinus tigrinus ALCF2SS1-7]|uniref:uncharacterized protein n=1 Tax=Lentinus tigrinus ALCF2SS1-7 TaxID=1328758 RepID=UPI0011661401|nr:hypothetical protein L226DRAFT_359084 [Lentinus tigrinus ALCF2SS1-7]